MKKQTGKNDGPKPLKDRAGKTGRQTGKPSPNLADTLSEEDLAAMVAGATFACARPQPQTRLYRDYAQRVDICVRRQEAEGAAAEKRANAAQSRSKSSPQKGARGTPNSRGIRNTNSRPE
jgi:hypothetical protein